MCRLDAGRVSYSYYHVQVVNHFRGSPSVVTNPVDRVTLERDDLKPSDTLDQGIEVSYFLVLLFAFIAELRL